jgi:hypothetical protein
MEYEPHKVWKIALNMFPNKRPEDLTPKEKQEVLNTYNDFC